LEQLLVAAQRPATLGLLAAGVAHDVANHLQVIQGFGSLLLAERPERRRDDHLLEVVRAAERAANLNRRLLRAGRGEAPGSVTTDLSALLADLRPLLERMLRPLVAFEIAVPAGLPELSFERDQLEQVVVNLVANARDAMPVGGRLEIGASHVGGAVLVEVRDTGSGIDPGVLPRIFEPLFTTKGEGCGLGLALSRTIVEAHGGSITVESVPGEGTTFALVLPLAA
jgi:two-component system, cell cycle sensor histidine kinase and response regulator CckA